jgi:methylphosphotriester-DNA--protein-cysteine methyltransferase
MRASDQVIEFLDAPKREDKYHRTQLDEVRLGDATTDQIQHYLACRRRMEEHLDEESVFDELCRLAMQSDEETNDWFDRVTKACHADRLSDRRALQLVETMLPIGSIPQVRLARIALGMLEDGWAEHEVRYALGTLGVDA